MTARVEFWIVILVLAAGTYAMRVIPFMAHGNSTMPRWLERLLRHVPAAALTALVVPGSLYLKAEGAYHFAPERTIAATLAMLVALKTKNMFVTLIVGMATLWIAQAIL